MKKQLIGVIATFILVLGIESLANTLVDPALKTFALSSSPQAVTRVLVLLKPVSLASRPNRYDRPQVVAYFKEVSRQSALPLLTSLQNHELPGVKVVRVLWINAAVIADVTPEGLKSLAHHFAVTKIYRNFRIEKDPLISGHGEGDYAFPSIKLDQLAAEHPEITGKGVVVGAVDTGVDATHPALQGKIPLFFNGETSAISDPKDFDEHGTHVSGTIVGGDRATNNIGVAPGAKLVMAGVVMQSLDAMLLGMQWFLDADKNPAVAAKIKSVGCSWNSGGAPDQEVFYRAIAAWEASGILPVFSAGNSGTGGITPPHEYPGTLAVAAYGADGNIADFSSRGPGHYHGQDTQKPDIAAPGVDVHSSLPGGNYGNMSGTSMAQPHASGVVALMLQVNPNLNPAQIKEILLRTAAAAQGQTPGQWSPEFGFGKLDAYSAVKASATHFLESMHRDLLTLGLDSNGPESILDQGFENLSLGEVDGEQDHYEDTDAAHWMTSTQLYGT